MKRNENIVELSRDHHFGLLCSWKIRQGLKKNIDAERIKKYIDYFWNYHLKEHFREEEEILFSYLKDEMSKRIAHEHLEIKNLVQKIVDENEVSHFENLAEVLEKHIRFEEREWFPHLEKNLNENQLSEIGKALQEIHSQEKDDYQDEFWK